ncbi:hypothetical protein DEO72_LG8g2638 [Vigna unguiculata]|uniref:Uncharacterized protein n=1 Tax=Vigna unguiculata TaxID=3917 RepID=A0A4D6MVD1_VIGUN|nr:hypothetical protein DEO72_LG8g2638 [Vigna unguiculata]
MAGYISAKTHVGSITTTSQPGMARYISARNVQVHLGQDTCWQHHNHIPTRNGQVHLDQEWPGTSRPGMARYISVKTHVGSITTTSQPGMTGYILAKTHVGSVTTTS